ncbi:putative Gag-Pol [Rosellinia necatrix]|uniref:Putative Gag-Pol n=1 Tax=Rosellinia necatrix TaxID=77044 RepID=A0A1W2TP88_ROSNE|nr:putative Gag-Pol [Rosellinia necatrix]
MTTNTPRYNLKKKTACHDAAISPQHKSRFRDDVEQGDYTHSLSREPSYDPSLGPRLVPPPASSLKNTDLFAPKIATPDSSPSPHIPQARNDCPKPKPRTKTHRPSFGCDVAAIAVKNHITISIQEQRNRGRQTDPALWRIRLLQSSNDYTRFTREMTDYLKGQGYDSLLLGRKQEEKPRKKRGESNTTYEKRLERWQNKQTSACATIRIRLVDNVRSHVPDESKFVTVSQTWSAIAKKYKPDEDAEYASLLMSWNNASLKTSGRTVLQLADDLHNIRLDMAIVSPDCKVSEPTFLNEFLSALGPDYVPFATSFRENHRIVPKRDLKGDITEAAVTFEDAVQETQAEEQFLKATKDHNATLIAIPRCTGCRERGNTAPKCYNLHPELAPKKSDYLSKSDQRRQRASQYIFRRREAF